MLKPRLMCAVAIFVASGVGGSSAFVADARAQDPPPPPPTTTVAEPEPDPAPPVQPAPKPKPTPKPVARQPRPRATVTPPQAPRIVQPQPATPAPAPAAKPKVRAKVKAKPKKAVRPEVSSKRKAAVASAQVSKTLEPGGLVPPVAAATPDDPVDFAAGLIVAALTLAIVCFGITSMPRGLLPRRAAYFVVEHQIELVVTGVGLFALTLFTFIWTGGR